MFEIFDYFIIGLLVFIIIAILIGKGDLVMGMMNGKRYENDPNVPKYDKKKEERAILIYCIILLADEALMQIGVRYSLAFTLLGIAIAIGGFVGVTYYLKKYAQIK